MRVTQDNGLRMEVCVGAEEERSKARRERVKKWRWKEEGEEVVEREESREEVEEEEERRRKG